MVRLPDGIDGERFFEKRCPGHRPEWVPTVPLDADSEIQACSIEEVPALVWTANLAALELHTPQATADDPWHPTAMVFDLDPGAPADVTDCARRRARPARPPRPAVAAVRREDVGIEGSAPVGAAAPGRRRRDDEGVRARARPAARGPRPEARHRDDGEGAARRPRLRRLEPERPPQDHGVRVLVAGDADSERVDAARRGTRSRRSPTATMRSREHSPADVIGRVEEHGDLYADSLAADQELPDLAS